MLADQPHPRFLSIPEVAAEFEVSETSVRRWIKDGRLKAIRLPSGTRRIKREDVETILASDTDESAPVGAA